MPVIDGPNTLITLDAPVSGLQEITVGRDLYSFWKVWKTGKYQFDTGADVSSANETITYVDHSLHLGQRIVYDNLGGVENVGLTNGGEYFIREVDKDTVELYDTKANAENSPSTTGRIDLTSSGAETHQWLTDNLKFLPAFGLSVGGDPLGGALNAGEYYFLNNQYGWRVTTTLEDQEVRYIGNLIPSDTNLPIITATPGHTVLHLGLQPITQGIVEVLRDLNVIRQIVGGRAVVSLDDLTVTIYDEDDTTVLRTFDISADGRIRTVTYKAP